ncbi:four helix bundle protein [Deferribacteraceae bacterium V6Fe1]|nr:four helix bundle protein [Deferribacteraceae bacterium V6Fe1]
MSLTTFRDLEIWKISKDLAVYIYRITENELFKKDFNLRDQVRRSAVSIPSNIAEGYERNTKKDFIRFLYISKGSLSELQTQIEIAKELNYLQLGEFDKIESICQRLAGMITNFIRYHDENK